MIKGVGKQIILLNNTDNELFEQAIFILKSGGKTPYKDVVKECEKMMNHHLRMRKGKADRNWWRIGFFLLLSLLLPCAVFCFIK